MGIKKSPLEFALWSSKRSTRDVLTMNSQSYQLRFSGILDKQSHDLHPISQIIQGIIQNKK